MSNSIKNGKIFFHEFLWFQMFPNVFRFQDNKEDCLASVENEIQKRRGGMSHVNMTHGRRTHGMTHGNSNSGESARTCVHCELPENLVWCQHYHIFW